MAAGGAAQIIFSATAPPAAFFQIHVLGPDVNSDSEAIRTLDPRLRRALLYPAELRNQPYFRMQR